MAVGNSLQLATVTVLDGSMGDPFGVDHLLDAPLGPRAKREVVLQHATQQLTAPPVDLLLELTVRKLCRVGPFRTAGRFLEARVRGVTEPAARLTCPGHRGALPRRCRRIRKVADAIVSGGACHDGKQGLNHGRHVTPAEPHPSQIGYELTTTGTRGRRT